MKQAHVLACGHSFEGAVETLLLSSLKARLCASGPNSHDPFREGFVSLIPSELALAVNHEDRRSRSSSTHSANPPHKTMLSAACAPSR